MPELPEVECLTRAIRAQILGAKVVESKFLRQDLRDPIPVGEIARILNDQQIAEVKRRSKYMLWRTAKGACGFHLGMTGNILLSDKSVPKEKHTHAIFKIRSQDQKIFYLHFVDPRRFGRIFASNDGEDHKFFQNLGPEPLLEANLAAHLHSKSRHKKAPIKSFLMDQRNVVGVGNIYASEALFRAKIYPLKAAGKLTRAHFSKLAGCIQDTLQEAIASGGTSFRDFKNSDGSPGYFEQKLLVYGRKGEPCRVCKTPIADTRLAGRSTFYCKKCQRS